MPKGKRKKGGKFAKMTEEEKRILLEQQRLAEEEMRKNKEELLSQFLKNKLAKEEKISKFSLDKINHQWRMIMRQAKSKELKKELEILNQTFERIIDRKNSIIRSLGKDLTEAEEQYAMAVRSHLQNVDSLIDIQHQRTEQLCQEFSEERTIVVEEFDAERALIDEQHRREMHQIEDIIHAMEQNFLDRENEARQEFQSTRDEIRAKNLEDKHALRVYLEGMVEGLWGQFTDALTAYQEATEERRQIYEQLKAKDEKSAKVIDQQMRKLQRIAEQAAHLKLKMSTNTKDSEERNSRIKEDRDIMLLHYNELKGQVNKIRNSEQQKLVDLTMMSNDALKILKEKLQKAERILKLAEMCRKLESEEEKVVPFYSLSLTNEEVEDIDQAVAEPPSEQLAEVMYKYTALENFWQRYNKVLLDKIALDRERTVIAQQNFQLRTLLKQYLDGISVNDEALAKNGSLVVISDTCGRLNVPVTEPRVKVQKENSTVIEAAHISRNMIK